MAQQAKVIDLTRTYLPIDPNVFTETQQATGEDSPEQHIPLMAYEGYNMMPTAQGYRSYFGLNGVVNVSAIPSDVDYVFVIQTNTYQNILIALCADGIYTKDGASSGAWTHAITVAPTSNSTKHYEWTYCIIENILYMYREGAAYIWVMSGKQTFYPTNTMSTVIAALVEGGSGQLVAGTYTFRIAVKDANGTPGDPSGEKSITVSGTLNSIAITWVDDVAGAGVRIYYKVSATSVRYRDVGQGVQAFTWNTTTEGTAITYPDPDVTAKVQYEAYVIHAVTPTFLNMTGQMGIFKIGGRLGMWDSTDAVARGSFIIKTDFVPSVTTQANVSTFTDVLGRIVTIKQHGDGCIIYATKSMIKVKPDFTSALGITTDVISNKAGIAYPNQVAVGEPDSTHFVWSTIGLFRLAGDPKVFNTAFVSELIATEVWDYLSRFNTPIYLQLLQGRHLFASIMNSDPIYGEVTFSTVTITPRAGYAAAIALLNGTTTGLISAAAASKFFGSMGESKSYTRDDGLGNLSTIKIPGLSVIQAGGTSFASLEDGIEHVILWTPMLSSWNYIATNYTTHPRFDKGGAVVSWTNGFQVTKADGTLYDMKPVPGGDGSFDFPGDVNTASVSHTNPAAWAHAYTTAIGSINYDVHLAGSDLAATQDNLTIAFNLQDIVWSREFRYANDRMTTIGRRLDLLGMTSTTLSYTYAAGVHYFDYNPATGTVTVNAANQYQGWFDSGAPLVNRKKTKIYSVCIPKRFSPDTYIWTAAFKTLSRHRSVIDVDTYDFYRETFAQNPVTSTYDYYHIPGTGISGVVNATSDTDAVTAVLSLVFANVIFAAEHLVSYYTVYTSPGVITVWFYSSTVVGPPYLYGFPVQIIPRLSVDVYCRYSMEKRTQSLPKCEMILACGIIAQEYGIWNAANNKFVLTATDAPSLGDTATVVAAACKVNKDPTQGLFGAWYYAPSNGSDVSSDLQPTTPVTLTNGPYSADRSLPSLAGASFLLQAGSPAPVYPTFVGAFVYDTAYKKWGKMKNDFKALLDFSPINAQTSNIIPFDTFGMIAAIIGTDKLIYNFDTSPAESFMRYGKFGIFRLGVTSLEEVEIQFGMASTGVVEVQTSLDGKTIEPSLTQVFTFTAANSVICKGTAVGKWHTIAIRGQYDLTYMEATAYRHGRR